MAKETRTEYETKEKTIEYTVCDCCDLEADDTVELSLNPREEKRTEHELVAVAETKEEAVEELCVERGFHPSDVPRHSRDPEMLMGMNPFGVRQNKITRPVEAEETFDVCMGCLRDVFDVDLPEDYESVTLDSGTLNVEVESVAPITIKPTDRLLNIVMIALIAFASGGLAGAAIVGL